MTQPNDVFATTTTEDSAKPTEDTNFLEQLVGEGKKFKDTQALAKGKVEADKFVNQLQEENAALREQLKSVKSPDDIVAAIRKELQATAQNSKEQTAPALDMDSIGELVQKQLGAHEQKKAILSNVQKANDALLAIYGDKAPEVLVNKANELGLTIDEMKALAAKSPSAFMAYFPSQGNQADKKIVKSTVNTQAINNTKANEDTYGTEAYWNAKRRELGRNFWDPKVQQEVFKCKKEGLYDKR